MPASIKRVAALLLLAFLLLAGALGYWVANGPALIAREDNPRRILAEQRIRRGSILDRNGEVIVETTGESGAYQRRNRYPYAAPFTGYYSINYGRSGVEEALDAVLRGTAGSDPARAQVDDLLHINPVGRAVQLTIDLEAQRAADELLDQHTGAIVILSVPDGEILALSSHPTFDPNLLDENWDALRGDPAAPLLNRATQGAYQPGTALQPILLAEALSQGAVALDAASEFPVNPFPVDAHSLECRTTSDVVTLADAFRAGCPTPFADLGLTLGSDVLWQMVATWGLTDTNVIGIQSTAALTQALPLNTTEALRAFAAGQGSVTVTPLKMAAVAATLAAHGVMPAPRLVSSTQSATGAWRAFDQPVAGYVASPQAIGDVVAAMPHRADTVWHAGMGLSGPTTLLWFIGFTPVDNPRYATAILIEREQGAPGSDREAISIGERLLANLPH
ncbi:MAG TPA: penicillin-binding transpeptidase domain-containing protein [Anaerolineae bacterium]|nr:penicillin-binding transpeptidase domain-containing protein [Anaerolineae bacterium]